MTARLALVLLLLTGCVSATTQGPTVGEDRRITLVVTNNGIDSQVIRGNGQRIGWVMAGRVEVLIIPAYLEDRYIVLEAQSMHGRTDFWTDFSPVQGECWKWEVRLVGSAGNPHARPC